MLEVGINHGISNCQAPNGTFWYFCCKEKTPNSSIWRWKSWNPAIGNQRQQIGHPHAPKGVVGTPAMCSKINRQVKQVFHQLWKGTVTVMPNSHFNIIQWCLEHQRLNSKKKNLCTSVTTRTLQVAMLSK